MIKKYLILLLLLSTSLFLVVLSWSTRVLARESVDMTTIGLTPYRHYLDEHEDADRPDKTIEIDLLDFEISNDMDVDVEGNTLITGERGAITWTFSVEKAGFY